MISSISFLMLLSTGYVLRCIMAELGENTVAAKD
jgi:hypothetical protein